MESMLMWLVILSGVVALLALLFAWYKARQVLSEDPGTARMQEISGLIHNGAMTFLKKQYQVLFFVIAGLALIMGFTPLLGWPVAISFIVGAGFSVVAGNIGMRIATRANTRTACAAEKSLNKGLGVAFSSGTVMGMAVVGLGLLGITGLYMLYQNPEIIFGFGFGASSIALFARLGGGIYTKAADVGADLVGKIEAGIPEDDPRNPAVIADNVGDNVGDVAGMGADLYESYVDAIIAAMALGMGLVALGTYGNIVIALPLLITSAGIIASIIGTVFVRAGKGTSPHAALNKGIFGSTLIMAVLSFFIILHFMKNLDLFWSVLAGLIAGVIVSLVTEYFTSAKNRPAQKVAEAARTGAGTNIIAGFSLGMMSTVIPVITICAAMIVAYFFAGTYGIAMAAVGMLSTLGITLATDTYGPVADNAAGIAEMAKMKPIVRKRAEELDAVGNSTAAIGKGFAVSSAVLTALALFASYTMVANAHGAHITAIDVLKPEVIVGVFIGGLMPLILAAISMQAVGKAAADMVEEVRRQFRTIKGLMQGKAKPDYDRCIAISTKAALREMVVPGLLGIIVPVLTGLLLGPEALGGLLAGTIVVGFLFAVFMANAGGAWDNAKKYIEAGNLGGKGSPTHKAAVVGDTVGDPFKDTSGPSINILIKVTSIVAVVFAPLIVAYGGWLLGLF